MISIKEHTHGRPSEFYGYVFVIVCIVLGFMSSLLSVTIAQNLGLSVEKSFLSFFRVALAVGVLVTVPPISVLVEMICAHWKKRKPHLLGVFAIILVLLEVVAAMFVTGYVFDLLFPELYFTNEPVTGLTGTILGLMIGLPLIVAALTIRTSKARAFLHKAFPD